MEAHVMDSTNISGSRTVSRAAMMICLTRTREEEKALKATLAAESVQAAAVDYGGEFIS
ncbi:MAG: HutP family protein, partial [Clostridia bacterium]